MASSDVDICNRALDAIGVENITALAEQTRAAGLCNRYFEAARDEVLRSHPWNCALQRAQLAALSTAPAFGFAYAYQLPADCLRVFEVAGENEDDGAWQVEGGTIVTDMTAPLEIRYVRRVTEVGLLDPLVVAVIVARLAMHLALPLTASRPMRQDMQREYIDALRAARSADGQEGTVRQVLAEDFARSRL